MKSVVIIFLCMLFSNIIFANFYEIEASGKILSNKTIELKEGYEKSIIFLLIKTHWFDTTRAILYEMKILKSKIII